MQMKFFARSRPSRRKVVYAAEVSRETTASAPMSVRDTVVTYFERNRIDPVVIEDCVSVGSVIPGEVIVREIPDSPSLGYVCLDGGPVVIERDSRRVHVAALNADRVAAGRAPAVFRTEKESHKVALL
jgi:hypothetical protein